MGGGFFDGTDETGMGAAAAKYALQGFSYLCICGVFVFFQQFFGTHDHTIEAIATLGGLFFDTSLLNGVQVVNTADTFEGGDLMTCSGGTGHHAGRLGSTIQQDHATSAKGHATSVFRAIEAEVVPEGIEQGHFRIDVQ